MHQIEINRIVKKFNGQDLPREVFGHDPQGRLIYNPWKIKDVLLDCLNVAPAKDSTTKFRIYDLGIRLAREAGDIFEVNSDELELIKDAVEAANIKPVLYVPVMNALGFKANNKD